MKRWELRAQDGLNSLEEEEEECRSKSNYSHPKHPLLQAGTESSKTEKSHPDLRKLQRLGRDSNLPTLALRKHIRPIVGNSPSRTPPCRHCTGEVDQEIISWLHQEPLSEFSLQNTQNFRVVVLVSSSSHHPHPHPHPSPLLAACWEWT